MSKSHDFDIFVERRKTYFHWAKQVDKMLPFFKAASDSYIAAVADISESMYNTGGAAPKRDVAKVRVRSFLKKYKKRHLETTKVPPINVARMSYKHQSHDLLKSTAKRRQQVLKKLRTSEHINSTEATIPWVLLDENDE